MKILGIIAAALLGLGSLGLSATYWLAIATYRAFDDLADVDLSGAVTSTTYLLATVFSLAGVALLVLAVFLAVTGRGQPRPA